MDKKWWTRIAVCTGTFMLLLDVTIVSRSAQGVGGAIMFATSLALLGHSFRGRGIFLVNVPIGVIAVALTVWRVEQYLPGDRGRGAGRVHRDGAARRAPHVRPVPAAHAAGLNDLLIVTAVLAFVGAASALLLIRGKDFVRSGGGEPQAAPAVPGGAAGADGVSPARSA